MPDESRVLEALQHLLPTGDDPSSVKLRIGDPSELELPPGGVPISDIVTFCEACLGRKDVADFLPGTFPQLQHLYLTELRFRSSEQRAVEQFIVGFEWHDAAWSLMPGVLEIEKLSLELAETRPSSSDALEGQGTVYGEVTLGDAALDIYVNLPALEFTASLSEGSHLSLKSLFDHFQLDSAGFEGLTVDRLTVGGSAYAGICSFEIDIADDPPLSIGDLAFESVALDVTYVGGPESEVYGIIGGVLELDIGSSPLSMNVVAQHAGRDAGWDFSADTETSGLHLNDLVGYLEETFLDGAPLSSPLPGEPELKSLAVSFNSHTKDFTFSCEVDFEMGQQSAPLLLDINLTSMPDGGYDRHFSGQLMLGDMRFDLIFDQAGAESAFLADYQNPGGDEVSLKALLTDASPDLAANLGDGDLRFKLKDALLAYETGGKFLAVFDMDTGVELSGLGSLPLIGSALGEAESLALAFQPLITGSDAGSRPDLDTIKPLLPDGAPPLPDKLEGAFSLSTSLKIGGQAINVDLAPPDDPSLGPDDASALDPNLGSPQPAPDKTAVQAPPSGSITWIDLQRKFGPLHFQRIGLGYASGSIRAALDASLAVEALTISLEGLGAEYELASKALSFSLNGLGVDFDAETLEIGGTFLRLGDDFAGKVIIKAESFAIDALGMYGELMGEPSMFIYAFLDYPLGGPTFFFVEGLAAGFGYNRRLTVPPIKQIHTFPLVAEVMGTQTPGEDIRTEFSTLAAYVAPQTDQYFLAVGLKFNSFKLVDCFALLSVLFGQHLEVDVMGQANIKVPAESPDVLAEVTLEFSAKFDPEAGNLLAQAQLSPESWFLSKDCHLHGGFAFASWFAGEHAGDFVYTLGGYHPDFKVPVHYPTVPRLGFDWKIDSHTSISGSLYFALTASAVMAGGSLSAVWSSDDVRAWFTVGADFLMAWKPYHYDARMHASIGAEVTVHAFGTHHIGISASADLHIWGPEFSGKAHVDVSVIGIDVPFTVEFGRSGSARPPKLGWEDFHKSFLPGDDSIAHISVQSGLIQKAADTWIVNAKALSFTTESAIPLTTQARLGAKTAAAAAPGAEWSPGIEPMGVEHEQLQSTLSITITRRDGSEQSSAEHDFMVTPLVKRMPRAVWNPEASPASEVGLNAPPHIMGVVGYKIHPRTPPKPGTSAFVERGELNYEVEPLNVQQAPKRATVIQADGEADREVLSEAFAQRQTTAARNRLLESLGVNPAADLRLSDRLPDAFIATPRVGKTTFEDVS